MEYRLNREDLITTISSWNDFLKRRIHLIACGGTALTLLEVKASTKDVDFIVPVEAEYDYLVRTLKDLGYKQERGIGWSRGDGYIFDLFRGQKVHTTNLLESPLKEGNHTLLKDFSRIYLGILNNYDILISKLFRGSGVDFEDCLALVKAKESVIDLGLLKARFLETSSYNVSEERMKKNLDSFLEVLKKEGIYEK